MNPSTNSFDGITAAGQSFADPGGGLTFSVVSIDSTHATIQVAYDSASGAAPTCIDGTPLEGAGPIDCTSTGAGGAGGGGGSAGGAGGMSGAAGAGGAGRGGSGGAGAGGIDGRRGSRWRRRRRIRQEPRVAAALAAPRVRPERRVAGERPERPA